MASREPDLTRLRRQLWKAQTSIVTLLVLKRFMTEHENAESGTHARVGPVLVSDQLRNLLDQAGDKFPRRSELKIVCGKVLARTGTWLKAAVLVRVGDTDQLRLCGWQLNQEGEWRLRQKFNISKSYAAKVSLILDTFATEE
jgi:hypothetical protein